MFEKVVLVTRTTRLEELIARYNTVQQARFYLEHAGVDFVDYQREHENYRRALDVTRRAVEVGLQILELDRSLLPTYTFTAKDVIVALGQDGLVANTAKYAMGQPILGVNPDPERFDGILLPFQPNALCAALHRTLQGTASCRFATMAEARLQDGQRILAFNDLFLGATSHVSARYRIGQAGRWEQQFSSGILISTGVGSTGWMSSVFHEHAGLLSLFGERPVSQPPMQWEDEALMFVVREPFLSRQSQVGMTAGWIRRETPLQLESQMPSAGVIFSDGVEHDRLQFNSGAVATVGIAREQAQLVWG